MRILAINSSAHMSPDETGSISRVVAERGFELNWWRRGAAPLPEMGDHAGLILFGGEMSVHDPVYRDYFDALSGIVLTFHAAGRPILGSCLGAQALAYAFGARVYPGQVEYGFASLTLTEDGAEDALLAGVPPEIHLFEMHGDTFDLPEGAILLARGSAVPHQIFRMGAATYGFQCHFEVTGEIVDLWSDRHAVAGDRLTPFVHRDRSKVSSDLALLQPEQLAFAEAVVGRWLDLARTGV